MLSVLQIEMIALGVPFVYRLEMDLGWERQS